MAARPRGADSKTGHQAGGGLLPHRGLTERPLQEWQASKEGQWGAPCCPTAPQAHGPALAPTGETFFESFGISSQPMFGQDIRAQSRGPGTATYPMGAAASLLLSSVNARKNEERRGGGGAQSSTW